MADESLLSDESPDDGEDNGASDNEADGHFEPTAKRPRRNFNITKNLLREGIQRGGKRGIGQGTTIPEV